MRIDLVEDDEHNKLVVLDETLNLNDYALSDAAREKWLQKFRDHLFTVICIKEGSETVH